MNPFALTVSFADGTEKTVTAVAADLIAFEQHFDKSVAILQTDYRLTYLFYICWHVLKRTGETKSEFDAWIETVSGIEASDDEKK
jgi:hypothetical protein